MLQDAEDKYHSYITDPSLAAAISPITRAGKRWGTLRKYQRVLEAAGKPKFDEAAEPYLNASLALLLRNELVHYRPATLAQGDTDPLPELVGRFPPNPLMDGSNNPLFPDKVLGAGAARWCVGAARELSDTFFAQLALTANYQRVLFSPPARAKP